MLKVRLKGTSAIAALTIASMLAAPFAYGQQPPAQQQTPAPGAGLAWPRDFDVGDSRLELYQPQINSWDGNKIGGRAAVAIGPKDGAPTYGFADFTAITTVDKAEGLVHLDTIAITKVEVPTAPEKAASISEALTKRLPPNGITVALDRLQASYAVNQKIAALKTQPVENTPPHIVFTDTLTVLVLISGDPDLKPVDGAKGFQRVINTRPLMLRDEKGAYHLQAAGTWYETSSLDSTWVVTPQPATALQNAAKIAAKQNAPDPLLAQDGKPITPPPAIYVSATPTELVQTNGQPQMLPVAGTGLLSMSNADHAVFMDPTNNAYYVLISGRWFRATDLRGPWAFVASDGHRRHHSPDRDRQALHRRQRHLSGRAAIRGDHRHQPAICRQHAAAGDPGQLEPLLHGLAGRVVRLRLAHGSLAGGRRGAGRDLYDPGLLARALCDLCADLFGAARDRGGRLHPRLYGRDGRARRHRGLWQRLLLHRLCRGHLVVWLPGDLWLWRRLRARRHRGLRLRLRRRLGLGRRREPLLG
ncbi:MAG: hypothetical protein B7Y61_15130, partial [Rhizobiales bacterium 35-66-30]